MRGGIVLAWASALVLVALDPAAARAGDAGIDSQVQRVLAEPGDAVDVGIWFGTPSGEPIYQRAASRPMAAASAVKTAILIELFAAHPGHLDDPLGAAADAVLADDQHPALGPFSAAQRDELRAGLRGQTVRTVGALMMGSKRASHAVYSGAANLAIASLGGPAELTAKIHARDAGFGGVAVRRYMLASRTANGDNEVTPASLAAVLASIATGHVPGRVDPATIDAMAHAMMQARDPALGIHRHKEGDLDTDPMACLKTGFYLRGHGKPPLIYVVGAILQTRPTGNRNDAHGRLDKMTDAVQAVLRAAASR